MSRPASLRTHNALALGAAGAAAVVGRALLGVMRWEPGWSALTWDDFTRVVLAREWAQDPFLVIGDLVWLPLQTWVYGMAQWAVGDGFADSPMVLAAVINTVAVVAASLLVGWSAWRLFQSRLGAFFAFLVILFAPWGLFVSLSGLSEGLYYLAVAGLVAGLVGWLQSRSWIALALGSLAVASATLLRYDGWTLAAAWAATVAAWELGIFPRLTGAPPASGSRWRPALRRHWRPVALAAAPLLVPLWYVAVNYAQTGDPLHFARESARYFSGAFGGTLFSDPLGRILYYPGALVRSAPLLGVLVAVGLVASRRKRPVRGLTFLVGLHFAMFYGTSLLSSAVGAFSERFMFAFILALAPLVGALPGLVGRLRPARAAIAVGIALAGLVVGVTVVRTADRPREWTHAPDLLELNAALGRATAGDQDPIHIALGPGVDDEAIPLSVTNGARVLVSRFSDVGTEDPAAAPPHIDLWVERLPQRIRDIGGPAGAVVGRYHLFGPGAERLDLDTAGCGCEGWVYLAEDGTEVPIRPSPYMALEFTADDPAPGAEAALLGRVSGGGEISIEERRIRWLYGHGFNEGRIVLQVRAGAEILYETDIAARSRWVDVEIPLPDDGEAEVEIAVVAEPGIETGWGWGRVSTVLVTES